MSIQSVMPWLKNTKSWTERWLFQRTRAPLAGQQRNLKNERDIRQPCTCKREKSKVQANSMLRIASSWPASEKAKAAQLWNQLLKAKDNLKRSVAWERLLTQSLIHIFLFASATRMITVLTFSSPGSMFLIFCSSWSFLGSIFDFLIMQYLNIYFGRWVLGSSPTVFLLTCFTLVLAWSMPDCSSQMFPRRITSTLHSNTTRR